MLHAAQALSLVSEGGCHSAKGQNVPGPEDGEAWLWDRERCDPTPSPSGSCLHLLTIQAWL